MRINVTLSKSSIGTFEECERKWALHYQRWKMPLDIRRDVFYQYKLMGHNALVGQVVDDLITYSIRLYARKGAWPTDLKKGARNLLQQYLDETNRWTNQYENSEVEPEEGRRQPVDRFFFDGPPDEAEIERLLALIDQLTNVWFASPAPEILLAHPVETWMIPPKGDQLPPSFELDGIKIWSKYDFAIKTDEETILYDWKTGRVNEQSEEDVRNQLHTYAAYAMREWGADPNRLKLFACWLAMGPENCMHEYPFEPERLEVLERIWRAKHELLIERLKMAKGNGALILELFPITNQIHRCRGCKFRICEGYRRLETESLDG